MEPQGFGLSLILLLNVFALCLHHAVTLREHRRHEVALQKLNAERKASNKAIRAGDAELMEVMGQLIELQTGHNPNHDKKKVH